MDQNSGFILDGVYINNQLNKAHTKVADKKNGSPVNHFFFDLFFKIDLRQFIFYLF